MSESKQKFAPYNREPVAYYLGVSILDGFSVGHLGLLIASHSCPQQTGLAWASSGRRFPLPPPPLIEQVSYFNLSKPLLPHLQNGVNLIYLQSCGKD